MAFYVPQVLRGVSRIEIIKQQYAKHHTRIKNKKQEDGLNPITDIDIKKGLIFTENPKPIYKRWIVAYVGLHRFTNNKGYDLLKCCNLSK